MARVLHLPINLQGTMALDRSKSQLPGWTHQIRWHHPISLHSGKCQTTNSSSKISWRPEQIETGHKAAENWWRTPLVSLLKTIEHTRHQTLRYFRLKELRSELEESSMTTTPRYPIKLLYMMLAAYHQAFRTISKVRWLKLQSKSCKEHTTCFFYFSTNFQDSILRSASECLIQILQEHRWWRRAMQESPTEMVARPAQCIDWIISLVESKFPTWPKRISLPK